MINVDRIYQRVLTLANKEQRGYITPQEFNLFANQAQMDIFEQYFYDLNQFRRTPGNDTVHADMVDMLEEKISMFEFAREIPVTGDTATLSDIGDFYRLSSIVRCMKAMGFETTNSTIIYGIKETEKKIKQDPDLAKYVESWNPVNQ